MSDITLPTSVTPIRWQYMVMLLAVFLATVLVAALVSMKVEQCRIVPGDFSNDFSRDFDVTRKVCNEAELGNIAAIKIRNAAARLLAELH